MLPWAGPVLPTSSSPDSQSRMTTRGGTATVWSVRGDLTATASGMDEGEASLASLAPPGDVGIVRACDLCVRETEGTHPPCPLSKRSPSSFARMLSLIQVQVSTGKYLWNFFKICRFAYCFYPILK